MLSCKNLCVSHKKQPILHDVSIDFAPKSITAIIGPSGCGKSTLLRTLNGSIENTELERTGDVFLTIRDKLCPISALEQGEVRRRIGLIQQQPTVFPMSIIDNMIFPLTYHYSFTKSEQKKKAVYYLQQAALYDEVQDILEKQASQLSGGQQQRLCIARSLTVEPDVLLLDEPCSALDIKNSMAIETMLRTLKEDKTIILVTHNLEQARRISDYLLFMDEGRIVEIGSTMDLFTHPRTEALKNYLSYGG